MNIVLYSTGCPQCSVLKRLLDNHGLQYSVCADANLMLQKGFTTVPMLEVNGQVMNLQESINWLKGMEE